MPVSLREFPLFCSSYSSIPSKPREHIRISTTLWREMGRGAPHASTLYVHFFVMWFLQSHPCRVGLHSSCCWVWAWPLYCLGQWAKKQMQAETWKFEIARWKVPASLLKGGSHVELSQLRLSVPDQPVSWAPGTWVILPWAIQPSWPQPRLADPWGKSTQNHGKFECLFF